LELAQQVLQRLTEPLREPISRFVPVALPFLWWRLEGSCQTVIAAGQMMQLRDVAAQEHGAMASSASTRQHHLFGICPIDLPSGVAMTGWLLS